VNALKLGGLLSCAIALLHIVIIAIGAPAYRYFGAGERMARQAEQGSVVPALLTAVISMVFGLFALYAFSGAGLIRRLPSLKLVLVAVGVIYTLRGLLLGPQVVWFFGVSGRVPVRQLLFSGVSFIVGLTYLVGVHAAWNRLESASPDP
jgi:hypothetical protein